MFTYESNALPQLLGIVTWTWLSEWRGENEEAALHESNEQFSVDHSVTTLTVKSYPIKEIYQLTILLVSPPEQNRTANVFSHTSPPRLGKTINLECYSRRARSRVTQQKYRKHPKEYYWSQQRVGRRCRESGPESLSVYGLDWCSFAVRSHST